MHLQIDGLQIETKSQAVYIDVRGEFLWEKKKFFSAFTLFPFSLEHRLKGSNSLATISESLTNVEIRKIHVRTLVHLSHNGLCVDLLEKVMHPTSHCWHSQSLLGVSVLNFGKMESSRYEFANTEPLKMVRV